MDCLWLNIKNIRFVSIFIVIIIFDVDTLYMETV